VIDHVTPIPFMVKGDVHVVGVTVKVAVPSLTLHHLWWRIVTHGSGYGSFPLSFSFYLLLFLFLISLSGSRRRQQQHLHDADVAFIFAFTVFFFWTKKKRKRKNLKIILKEHLLCDTHMGSFRMWHWWRRIYRPRHSAKVSFKS
jgi:hypothetical protein